MTTLRTHLATILARAIHRALTKPWTPRREVLVCGDCRCEYREGCCHE